MSQVSIEDERIKGLIKQAILEVLEEHQDDLYNLFAEALEDLALVNAIREGESRETVSKADVLAALEATA